MNLRANVGKAVAKFAPALLPVAREFAFRLGPSEGALKISGEVADLRSQWSDVLLASRTILEDHRPAAPSKKILFVTGYGLGSHWQAIEPILMFSLHLCGAKITSLSCNTGLPACEFNKVGNDEFPNLRVENPGLTRKARTRTCGRCVLALNEVYSLFPFNRVGIDQYITAEDRRDALQLAESVPFDNFRQWTYEGMALGEEAFASVLRSTFMGTVRDTDSGRKLVKRYLVSCILYAIALKRYFLAERPDRIVMIHGLYVIHGVANRVANSMGIPIIVVGGGGIRKDTVLLCHGDTYHRKLIDEENGAWENETLTENRRARVFEYAFKKRHQGDAVDYFNYHPSPIENRNEVLKELGIDDSRPIATFFTNVIWDAQILYKSNVFQDIHDWVFATIELAAANPNAWFVFRIHPAESKTGNPTLQPMLAEINARFPNLPSNVRVVPPESDISSYKLAEMSVCTAIYGTKMGLELALMRVPLLICGETFSRNKGYGVDINSKAQYVAIMKNVHNYINPLPDAFERAVKYADYLYFRRMLDVPVRSVQAGIAGSGRKLGFSSLAELAPGRNPELDVITRGILDLQDFVLSSNDVNAKIQEPTIDASAF